MEDINKYYNDFIKSISPKTVSAETAARLKAEEEARLAAEKAEQDARLAAEKAKAEDDARLAAEKAEQDAR